ncbi:MAG: tRNA (guanosine(46)-N7)-methyltransferase TrmB, partial [Firmicutes bacterium]|nr:tRNA (guanosine(46)-N7)-methyltransferase TrmB [Bacillota bacterium]
VVRGDAHDLLEYFAPGEVDRIYLNFSDPWPKERHAKRRLTSTKFLPIYKTILKQGGILQMKTDNDNLYAFSLETLKNEGWTIIRQSADLHNSPYVEGNVMTEYETHFHELGKNINYFQALPPEI